MHEHSSRNSTYQCAPPELPPCCGTGCAVCVLDLADEYVTPRTESLVDLPTCCNTGCLVCVNNHPELFRDGRPDAHTLELLAAMETAERALR